jgi:hypothetical protein
MNAELTRKCKECEMVDQCHCKRYELSVTIPASLVAHYVDQIDIASHIVSSLREPMNQELEKEIKREVYAGLYEE